MPYDVLKDLKVAVVGPLPPPAGGMANQAKQLVELLEQAGVSVHFVRVNSPYWPSWVASAKGLRAIFRLLPYLYHLRQTIRQADLVHLMANSGWSWHLFAAPCVWLAWLLKKPVIINYRGGEADTFFQQSWSRVWPTIKRSQAVIVPSGFLQMIFIKRGVHSDIVPNLLDLERFNAPRATSVSAEAPHLVVTRNLEEIYGVDTILHAFAVIRASYQHATLSIAGSGPQENALKTLCRTLGLQDAVEFCGRLEAEQIVRLYQRADLLLNASRVDNSPNSLIEALASGVPVVSSNVGGIPYLVESERSALLVPADDPQALAEAAMRVLGSTELREHLIAHGKEVAARFDSNKVLIELAKVYQRVLG